MGLVHTPKTIASIIRGQIKLLRSSSYGGTRRKLAGIGQDNPHIYVARAGLFDIDYLGHMNNTAYLTHSELARWQLVAENGILFPMINSNAAFVVTGNSVRYRKEILAFSKFLIETRIECTDKNMWIDHVFRDADGGRIKSQVLVKAVIIQNGRVVENPENFLVETCKIDSAVIDQLKHHEDDKMKGERSSLSSPIFQKIVQYNRLEKIQQHVASRDDEKQK
mmetsp:Transcript_37163/g.43228  ORF Transcript_37163/g.43228 Transcript_37163/m.43228 type:complete len:222 (-) Transcript_37163:60-725(-)